MSIVMRTRTPALRATRSRRSKKLTKTQSMRRRKARAAKSYTGGDDLDYEAHVRQTLANMTPLKARIMAKKLGIKL